MFAKPSITIAFSNTNDFNLAGDTISEKSNRLPPGSPSCSSANTQYVGGLIYKSAGGLEIVPSMQKTGTSGSSVVPGQTTLK